VIPTALPGTRQGIRLTLWHNEILVKPTLVLFLLTAAALAQTADFLAEIIRVNTSNPPGQEGKLDELLATKFKPLGFEVDIIQTPEPGKAHFIARLRGDGSKKPILLAAHADVVGVEREKWSIDAFAGCPRFRIVRSLAPTIARGLRADAECRPMNETELPECSDRPDRAPPCPSRHSQWRLDR